MSSHHIVRENQEPALFILSFNALGQEHIGQLLEWSPSILTDELTIDFLLAAEIKVDFVVSIRERTYPQTQVRTIFLHKGVIEDGLQYLIDHRYGAVNIICDEIPASIYRYSPHINIVLFVAGKRYVLVRNKYEKWKQGGESIYIREDRLKSLAGLVKVEQDTFVTQQDGFIYLEFNTHDFILVGEDI